MKPEKCVCVCACARARASVRVWPRVRVVGTGGGSLSGLPTGGVQRTLGCVSARPNEHSLTRTRAPSAGRRPRDALPPSLLPHAACGIPAPCPVRNALDSINKTFIVIYGEMESLKYNEGFHDAVPPVRARGRVRGSIVLASARAGQQG